MHTQTHTQKITHTHTSPHYPARTQHTPTNQVSSRFDTYVMTAGTRDYAEPLLDVLDPNRVLKGRFYRDSCVFHEGHYFKDLRFVLVVFWDPPCSPVLPVVVFLGIGCSHDIHKQSFENPIGREKNRPTVYAFFACAGVCSTS